MPFLRISLLAGKPPAYRQDLMDSLALAMQEAMGVPEDDQFMVVSEHGVDSFRFGASYLGVARSADLVYVQIAVLDTRPAEQKKAFYRAAVARLAERPGLRPEDVFINVVDCARENWSLGRGLAQYD